MRQVTGVASSSPISIYTVDNVIPLSIIDDDTEVFKLSSAVSTLDLSCTDNNLATDITGSK